MNINNITIRDENIVTGLETGNYPYYRQDTEIMFEDGEFKVYINEFGVDSLEQVKRERRALSPRCTRMGVEFYRADGELIWKREPISP